MHREDREKRVVLLATEELRMARNMRRRDTELAHPADPRKARLIEQAHVILERLVIIEDVTILTVGPGYTLPMNLRSRSL